MITKIKKKNLNNNDVMQLFRDAEDIKADDSLTAEEKSKMVREIHDTIINGMTFLVRHKTKSYKNFPNYQDLVQEGLIGLIKAVQRFDCSRYPNFFKFSEQWIINYIKRSASKFDVVYNPSKERVVYSEPADLDIEEETEISPEEIFLHQERAEMINRVLSDLPDRDREIVQRIYGIGGYKPQTLREIGPLYNLTYERVRQIKENVVVKLRKDQNLNELS